MKKIIVLSLALLMLIALASCSTHEHSFGEWETKTPATCTSAEVEVSKCSCGEEQVRDGDAAVDHDMVSAFDEAYHWTACSYDCGTVTEKAPHVAASIKAVCNKTDYIRGDVALAADFTVTATCECGASYQVSEGVTLENATLENEGANIVSVKLGNLATNVQVNAGKFIIVLDGAILEDTYVFSNSKDTPLYDKETMGTHSGSFRVFLKYDFSKILDDQRFVENIDDAKVQFSFTIVEGAYTENTMFSFGGFIPGPGVSDVNFTDITWNVVRNTPLDWANATQPLNEVIGSHHVSFDETTLTLTFNYAQIKDFVDENGIGIFTLRAKESGVKISSMEGTSAPTVSVIIDESHLHAFDQKVESDKYFISANCGEYTYYFKSCQCGEFGVDYFKTDVINEHQFGEWTVVNPATCTEDGAKQRTCTLCENGVEDAVIEHTGHAVDTNWSSDESYHWNNCANCDEKFNSATHAGGTATETEKATCETCGIQYGGLASHVHNHSAAVTEPTCTEAGFTTYTCTCGDVYTGDNVDALGHNMETKYDADNHWTECSRCGEATAPVAHFGGEATTTEKAVCEVCGQSYGDFKSEEPSEVTISGTIVQDTYITSDSSGSSKNFAEKNEINCNNGKNFRPIFEFNLANVLNNSEFMENKATAKVEFTFAVSTGDKAYFDETDTKFSIYGFIPGAGVSDVDFTTLTWNSCKETGANSQFYRKDTNTYFSTIILNQTNDVASAYYTLSEVDGVLYITYTLDYSAIEHLICTTAGDNYGDIVMGFDFNKSIKLASMENTSYAIPAVAVTYSK